MSGEGSNTNDSITAATEGKSDVSKLESDQTLKNVQEAQNRSRTEKVVSLGKSEGPQRVVTTPEADPSSAWGLFAQREGARRKERESQYLGPSQLRRSSLSSRLSRLRSSQKKRVRNIPPSEDVDIAMVVPRRVVAPQEASEYMRLAQQYIQLLAAPLEAGSFVLGGEPAQEGTVVRIEVDEDPLTVELMGTLFSTLTTLTTKYWLISQGRFVDLIEFYKSHDGRFVRKDQAVITRISYNSPLNFDIKLSATDTAQAVTTTIDGIVQTGQRFRQMELATKTKEQEFQQAEQRFAEEVQRTQKQEAFEQEKRQLELARQQIELERLRLEVEQQRLGLLEVRLDAQRKSLEHAFEIAHKVIGQLHPQVDDATKRMLVQTYVGDILQLSGIAFTSVTVVKVDTASSAQKEKEE